MTAAPDYSLIHDLRTALAGHADPAKAPAQRAYMKSAMPYRGLTAPVLRTAIGPVLAARVLDDRAGWEATARALWDEATFREDRYAAIALLRHRPYAAWAAEAESVQLYRYFIETGAWWDFVDEIAANLVGTVLLAHRESEQSRMRAWAVDQHLWVRRSAILCQLTFGARTDRTLLVDTIQPNLADRDFFIRKAIGWALRQYAREQPDWVRAVVAGWDDRLSGLSRREALKHLGPGAPARRPPGEVAGCAGDTPPGAGVSPAHRATSAGRPPGCPVRGTC